jgi:hypothetical protein
MVEQARSANDALHNNRRARVVTSAGAMVVVIAAASLLLPIGIAAAQPSAEAVHPSVQIPGPAPRDLKNLSCEKLEALEGSVTTMNGTAVGKANIYEQELLFFQTQYTTAACDKQLQRSSYCSKISAQLTDVGSKINQVTTETDTLNGYYKEVDDVAKGKDCAFEKPSNEIK